MSSKEKYLKYKLKYINLRNNMILMKGGTHTPESLKALITEFITTNLILILKLNYSTTFYFLLVGCKFDKITSKPNSI